MFNGRVTVGFFLYFQKFKSKHIYTCYENKKNPHI